METFLKLIKIAFVILNAYVALKLSMLVFDRNFMRFDNQVRLPLMVVVLLIGMLCNISTVGPDYNRTVGADKIIPLYLNSLISDSFTNSNP